MRRWFWGRALGSLLPLLPAGSVAQETCWVERPESAVFDIVAVDDPTVTLGTAFLVDAQRALFLTAYHNLVRRNSPTEPIDLILKNGSKEFTFYRIASGNNVVNLYDDWALLRVKDVDPRLGVFPLPEVHVVYDLPTFQELGAAYVLSSSRTLRTIQSLDWSEELPPGDACESSKVAMVEISTYERGYSGAPVFSKDLCGVVGLTSRFILPGDTKDPIMHDIVKAFYQYSRRVDEQKSVVIADDSIDITERTEILRELIKNKVFVKLIPSKCIIDELVTESFAEGEDDQIRSLIRGERMEMVEAIISSLRQLDTNNWRDVINISLQIKSNKWDWIDLLQIWDQYYQGTLTNAITEGPYRQLLLAAIIDAGNQLNYRFVSTAYWRAMRQAEAEAEALVDEPKVGLAEAADSFIRDNADWGEGRIVPGAVASAALVEGRSIFEPGEGLGFHRMRTFAADLDVGEALTAGMTLAGYADGSTPWPDSLSPDARSIIVDGALAYLSAAVSDPEFSSRFDAARAGEALTKLALLVRTKRDDLGVPVDSSLVVNLAAVAAELLPATSDTASLSRQIVRRELENFEGGVAVGAGDDVISPASGISPASLASDNAARDFSDTAADAASEAIDSPVDAMMETFE